jgi:hypothetical protein
MNLTRRPEVAGLRTSVVCEHIRNPHPAGPGWRAALGLLLAPLKSSALRDWETRVTGKGDVPCGARAAEVGGASVCLVELRVPAGAAEPWRRAQPQPRSIRRPFRHETQNMPLCWLRLGRVMAGRDSRPPDASAAGESPLLYAYAGVRRAAWVRCSAEVQFVRVVLGELHV